MTTFTKSACLVICLCVTLIFSSCGGGGTPTSSRSSGGSQGNPAPSVTSLSPYSALVGASAQTLTINGTGFMASSTVTYNDVSHAATLVSSTELTIQLGASDQATAGTDPVVVTNPAPGGGSSAPVNFIVDNPTPAITSVSPQSALAESSSQTLTINGTGFVAGSEVTFNGTSVSATFANVTELTAQLSASQMVAPGTYPVVVTNPGPGGGASNSTNFAVTVSQQSATTDSNGIVDFPKANLSVKVIDIASQQGLTGMNVALVQDALSQGLVLTDPQYKYAPGFFLVSDPAAPSGPTTLDFAAQACAAPCSTTVSVTGQYQWDGSTETIGTWSFNLSALGLASISGTGGSVELFWFPSYSYYALTFTDATANSGTQFTFNVDAPSGLASNSIGGIGTNSGASIHLESIDVTQAGATFVAGLIPSALANDTDPVQAIDLPNDLLGQYSTGSGTSSNCSATTVGNVDPYLSQIISSALTPQQAQSELAIAEKFPLNVDGAATGDTGAASLATYVIERFGPASEAYGVQVHYKLWGYTDSTPLRVCITPFGLLVSPEGTPTLPVPSTSAMTSGTIVDASTGLPITGATIGVAGVSIPAPLTTDSSGGFTAPSLVPGPYDVTATAPGYVPNGEITSLQAGQQGNLVIQLAPYQGSAEPFITSATVISGHEGQGIVIDGTGFGATPPQTTALPDGSVDTLACYTTAPSLTIRDSGTGAGAWAAGRETCTNTDAIGLHIASWSDTQIVLNGFGSTLGTASNPQAFNISALDPLTAAVFGPNNSGAATYNLQVAPTTPIPAGSSSTTVRVSSGQAFTDTGISLNAGDDVTINASGLVTLSTNGSIPPMSPAGFPPDCTAASAVYGQTSGTYVASHLPCWSLVGRIGANGPIFEVGSQAFFSAPSSGELYLGLNDNSFTGNSGNWTTSIQVDPGGN